MHVLLPTPYCQRRGEICDPGIHANTLSSLHAAFSSSCNLCEILQAMTSLLEPGGTLGIAALVDESISRTKESPSRIHSNGALGMDKEMNQTRDVDWADLQVITAEGESRNR